MTTPPLVAVSRDATNPDTTPTPGVAKYWMLAVTMADWPLYRPTTEAPVFASVSETAVERVAAAMGSEYVQQMLLDPRTLSRPYIERKAVEAIVHSHLREGRNYTTEIHKLLTLELLHRLFFDSQ